MTDLARLAELARKATPRVGFTMARYHHGGARAYIDLDGNGRKLIADFYREGDRELFAACSPDVILALLSDLERKDAALNLAREALKHVQVGTHETVSPPGEQSYEEVVCMECGGPGGGGCFDDCIIKVSLAAVEEALHG